MRNDIIVRGNSSIGILWRMDGVEIPNPNHFSTSGATGGGISMLNNNLLAKSDFMTSAFPAEYGNATSGVFDLKMRKGNNEEREYIFQVGANGFELGAEGPFNKEKYNSYLISYRYSTLGVLGLIGALDFIGAVPDYQDLSFKLHFPNSKGYFSVFGIGGMSIINFDAIKDSLAWIENGDDQYKESAGSKTGIIGTSLMHFISPKTYFKAILSTSIISSFYKEHVLNSNYEFLPEFKSKFDEGKTTVSLLLNHKIDARNTIRTGIIFNNLTFDVQTDNYIYNSNFSYQQKDRIIDYSGSSNLIQSYGQWKHKFHENITFNIGAHYMYYLLNDRQTIEPRSSIQFQFKPKHSISFGFGMHSKLLPPGVYFGEIMQPDGTTKTLNKDLDFVKSNHYVFGYDYSISKNLRLKMETYYQEVRQVPVYASSSNSFSGINMGVDFENIVSTVLLSSKGTGTNYGVELTLEKFFSGGYYFLLTGSLFESKYKGSDGIERNTVFNGNYATNFLGGKEFKFGKNKDNILSFNITIVNIGGKRMTPIDLDASRMAEKTVRVDSLAFSQKLKDYFRLDLRIGFKFNRKKSSHEIAFEAKNLLNEQNIFLQYYSTTTDKVVTEYQMGLFPILVYRIQF